MTVPGLRPIHIMTKPIGPICNLDCAYCYYLEKEALYPGTSSFKMSDALLEHYVRQYIEASPGPQVHFAWQGGEPTLMGLDFFRRVVELQQKYLPSGWTCTNALQTNGTLLTPDWCEFLKANHFLVGISIDGPAHLHDHYRVDKGQRPTHSKVMRGLRLLQEHGVEYNVLCVVNNVNAEEPLNVYNFFKENGVEWIQFIPIVEHLGDGKVSSRSVGPEQWGRFLTAIFDEWVRHDVGRIFVQTFEETIRNEAGLTGGLCVFQETCGDALAMEHNGDLFSCDHFVLPEFKLGNILELPIVEMANSPEQIAFGKAKRDALPSYCRRCEVLSLCYGECPKNRFVTTPDGEPGLNYLCAGYRRFFNHVRPTVQRILALLNAGKPPALIMDEMRAQDERRWQQTGRNEPCPCGSGKKYKRCCWGRV